MAAAAAAEASTGGVVAASAAEDAAPPFDLEAPRFDQSTYWGRLSHFLQMTDMRLILTTDEQLADARAKLEAFKAGGGRLPEGVSNEEMWRARQVKEATIHPVTDEPMFLPGRMCCFVPSNLPSTVGMLMATTAPGMLFWHWFNQSVNVMVNYTNRSGAEVNMSQLSQAYGLAVVSSCSVAIGASALVKRGPRFVQRLGFAVPYTAVVTAGAGNVIFTRWPEVNVGVPIRDAEGKTLGLSSKAALESIKLTVISRNAFLPMTPMLVPPLVMAGLRKMPIVAAGGAVAIATEVTVVAACIAIGLPLAIAVFPQETQISTAALEEEFQNLKDSKGQPVEYVLCNKGL